MWASLGAVLAVLALSLGLFFTAKRQGASEAREKALEKNAEKVRDAAAAARKVDELSDDDVAKQLREQWRQ